MGQEVDNNDITSAPISWWWDVWVALAKERKKQRAKGEAHQSWADESCQAI